jgi:hypothetical protein
MLHSQARWQTPGREAGGLFYLRCQWCDRFATGVALGTDAVQNNAGRLALSAVARDIELFPA